MKAPITTGSIVKYHDGHYRVSRVWTSYSVPSMVNLSSIFGGVIRHKRVPIQEVEEDEANWYKAWQESESYQCQ